MQIKDIMTNEVALVAPDTTLAEAARIMAKKDVGILPVGENDHLVGVITDRDIVVRGLAKGHDPESAEIGDAMTDRVLYCFDDQPVETVASNMAEEQIRRLPVVNRDKRLVGIVSIGDLAVEGSAHRAGEALGGIAHAAE
ncbi:MAG TPA: CBS domain-containing protein [Kiloniellales bacterium]|nr:CBS domain-containing protein [Kiloniellales bacterium]